MVGALPDGGGAHLAQPVEHNAQLVAMRLAVEHVQLVGCHAVHMDPRLRLFHQQRVE